jgi:hypothetical protein
MWTLTCCCSVPFGCHQTNHPRNLPCLLLAHDAIVAGECGFLERVRSSLCQSQGSHQLPAFCPGSCSCSCFTHPHPLLQAGVSLPVESPDPGLQLERVALNPGEPGPGPFSTSTVGGSLLSCRVFCFCIPVLLMDTGRGWGPVEQQRPFVILVIS